ncbi:MAG: HNH endonuclease signature motif containing protein, partial [Acidimicrobiales bacterium]
RPLLHHHDQPLDLGRSQRLVNRAQRRALRFRDGPGCAFPGCSARHVDAHHIEHWADGGATDIANLVQLCRHHHRLLHEGGYRAALIDNRPRFYRPDHTPIRPPDPPPPDPTRGSAELRRRHHQQGHTIDRTTPGARSGGSPHWSPQAALDALLS